MKESSVLLMGEDVEGALQVALEEGTPHDQLTCLVKVGLGALGEAGGHWLFSRCWSQKCSGEGWRAAGRGFSGFATSFRGSGYLTSSTHLLSPLLNV